MNLTTESLARALHEDHFKAYLAIRGRPPIHVRNGRSFKQAESYDDLPNDMKAIYHERARLLLERIMR